MKRVFDLIRTTNSIFFQAYSSMSIALLVTLLHSKSFAGDDHSYLRKGVEIAAAMSKASTSKENPYSEEQDRNVEHVYEMDPTNTGLSLRYLSIPSEEFGFSFGATFFWPRKLLAVYCDGQKLGTGLCSDSYYQRGSIKFQYTVVEANLHYAIANGGWLIGGINYPLISIIKKQGQENNNGSVGLQLGVGWSITKLLSAELIWQRLELDNSTGFTFSNLSDERLQSSDLTFRIGYSP